MLFGGNLDTLGYVNDILEYNTVTNTPKLYGDDTKKFSGDRAQIAMIKDNEVLVKLYNLSDDYNWIHYKKGNDITYLENSDSD